VGWFSDKIAHTLTYKDANARVKVDEGSTGFFLGRETRAYFEFVDKAASAVRVFKVVSPVDFILLAQRVTLDSGAMRVSAWVGGTEGGTFNVSVPVILKNRMSGRPTPSYVPQMSITTGGTYNKTGGTELDLLRIRSATQNTNAVNVGAGGDDYRGLPAGTYYIVCEQLTGTPANNDAVNGKYEIVCEERPNGNQA
jgi:hypothetical protein